MILLLILTIAAEFRKFICFLLVIVGPMNSSNIRLANQNRYSEQRWWSVHAMSCSMLRTLAPLFRYRIWAAYTSLMNIGRRRSDRNCGNDAFVRWMRIPRDSDDKRPHPTKTVQYPMWTWHRLLSIQETDGRSSLKSSLCPVGEWKYYKQTNPNLRSHQLQSQNCFWLSTYLDRLIFVVGTEGESPRLNQLQHLELNIFMRRCFDEIGEHFTILLRTKLVVDGRTAIFYNTFQHLQTISRFNTTAKPPYISMKISLTNNEYRAVWGFGAVIFFLIALRATFGLCMWKGNRLW